MTQENLPKEASQFFSDSSRLGMHGRELVEGTFLRLFVHLRFSTFRERKKKCCEKVSSAATECRLQKMSVHVMMLCRIFVKARALNFDSKMETGGIEKRQEIAEDWEFVHVQTTHSNKNGGEIGGAGCRTTVGKVLLLMVPTTSWVLDVDGGVCSFL